MFYHFFMTYQLEHEQAEPTRVAGPFSASSSHREPVTEHQGPEREAEKLRNRLREGGGREGGKQGGNSMVFHRAKSEIPLACAWSIPPCGGCSVPPAWAETGSAGKGGLMENVPLPGVLCRRVWVGSPLQGWLLSRSWNSPARAGKVLLVPSWNGCADVMHANLYANMGCLWTQKNTRTHQNKEGLPQPPFFHPLKE